MKPPARGAQESQRAGRRESALSATSGEDVVQSALWEGASSELGPSILSALNQ